MNTHYQELTIETNLKDFIVDFVFAFDIDAVEEKDNQVIIRSESDLDDLIFALEELKNRLNNIDFTLDYHLETKENKDWINEYRKNINPIQIDDIYIHTTWQEAKNNCINIQIDPALAFGSGHHESTSSCVHFLQKYYKGAKNALDVGCGSGILSLVLAKYGLNVDACDTDELAVMSTKSNFKINNLELNNIWIGSCDKSEKTYDIVCANIIADVILILKNDLIAKLHNNSILVLSGILKSYEDRIKKHFASLELIDEKTKGDWLTLVYKAKNEQKQQF